MAAGVALRAAEETNCKPYFKRKEGEAKPESLYALAALRLAILTGMRKSEIIGDNYRGMPALTWADVDLAAGILSVHHKTETKTGKKHTIHLCTAARQLLRGPAHHGQSARHPGRGGRPFLGELTGGMGPAGDR